MVLRGIQIGNVTQGAGATNFYGQGWWYHKLLHLFGLDFKGSVFTTKTGLLTSRKGNMPLRKDGCTPRELFPRCIVVNRRTLSVVNSVGLSGFDLLFYLKTGRWQARTTPFFLSLALQETTPLRILGEARQIVGLLLAEKKHFRTSFIIQLNDSCPNISHAEMKRDERLELLLALLDVFADLDAPFTFKIGYDFPIEWVPHLEKHSAFDAWVAINTLKWDALPAADRVRSFGSETSPLEARLGPGIKGGISGAPLLPYALDYIKRMREARAHKPIIAGGGACSTRDAVQLMRAAGGEGNAVSVASISMLRPTRVQQTIKQLNALFPAGRSERVGPVKLVVAART